MNLWKIYSSLSRFYLSLAVALSGLIGFIFYEGRLNLKAFMLLLGIFLLSNAASALNQYQERALDALLPRTQNRPLPAQAISIKSSWLFICSTCLSGLLILLLGANLLTAVLGAFNLLWYGAVYTPLKMKTKYAVFLGAICGVIPPIMGWTAAGGSMFNYKIVFIALFVFLWQIPHVFLLHLKYQNEFESAKMPLILSTSDQLKNRRLVFYWILATILCTFLYPLFNIFNKSWLILLLLIVDGIVLLYSFYHLFFIPKLSTSINKLILSFHFYQLIIFALIILATE